MAKKARTSRPRRAAAPADGFAAPPQEMDLEEEEPAPPRRKKEPLVPLAHVIAKCPRAELEELLLASANNAEPVTREDLEAAAARHAPPPKAVIELGNEREGTGAFDAIDTQCLGAILEQLPTSDRLTLASVVCKSWRRLRMAKGLWTSFCLNELPFVLRGGTFHGGTQPIWPPIAGVLRPHSRERGPGRLRSVAATQLLDWIGDKDGVFELGVDTSDGALSAEVASAAIKSFPNLRTLSLDGKQILARTLRTRYPCQSKLKTLVVGRSVLAGVKGALASFLGACTSLETLCAPAELATFEVLEAAATAWKEARGGAAPLLAHLKLYGYAGYNNDPFASPAAAGGWFGNLETFVFTPRSYGQSVEEGWTHVPTFAKMNRLKSLHVGPLSQGWVPCISTTALGQLLPQLLAAAPNLEHLWVQGGRPSNAEDVELPRLADTLATLPPSLKKLELMDVAIQTQNLVTHSLAREGSVFVRDCDWLDGNGELFDDSSEAEDDDARRENYPAPRKLPNRVGRRHQPVAVADGQRRGGRRRLGRRRRRLGLGPPAPLLCPPVTKKLHYYNAPGGRSTSRRTNCRAAGLICSGGLNNSRGGLGAGPSRIRAADRPAQTRCTVASSVPSSRTSTKRKAPCKRPNQEKEPLQTSDPSDKVRTDPT